MASAMEPRVERIARVWLWSSTLVFPSAAILLSFADVAPPRAIFLLPMANCGAIWALVFFGARRNFFALTKLRLEILAGRSSDEVSSGIRDLRAAAWSLFPLLLWPWLLILVTWALLILNRSAA